MINLTKIYSQNDPQCSNQQLGTSNSLIGPAGCFVTAYANLANYYGHDVNVTQMNQLLIDTGQFYDGSEIASGDSLSKVYSDIVYQTRGVNYDMLKDYLNSGFPVILNLYAPNLAGSHFVLALGYDGDKIMIADSWDGGIKPASTYGGIQEMIFFKGTINNNQNNNTDMTTLTDEDYNTIVSLGFKENADVLKARGITSGDYTDRVRELNDSIQRPLFHTAIQNQEFDTDTRTKLDNAINNKDASYIVAFSGSAPRKYLDAVTKQSQGLENEVQTLTVKNSTLNQAKTDLENKLSSTNASLEPVSKKVQDLELQVDTFQKNSSEKPVWASKKAIVTILATIGFTVLAIYDPNTFLAVRNSPIFPMIAIYILSQTGVDITNISNQTKPTDASRN